MTDQQILETAIQKAIDGGWKFAGSNDDAIIAVKYRDDYFGRDPYFEIDWHMSTDNDERSIEEVIFNHDFAKALWGDTKLTMLEPDVAFPKPFERWKFMLQFMVIADDPIKYLGDHLPAQKEAA